MYVPPYFLQICSPNQYALDGSWGFRFAMECVADVAARTLTAEAPSYTTIMDLDRKVREFPLPEDALAIAASSTPISDDKLPPALAMMRCVMSHTREVSKYTTVISIIC